MGLGLREQRVTEWGGGQRNGVGKGGVQGGCGTTIGLMVLDGTTHDIGQIHDSPRMARIENSSQPTSSRKGFDKHIVAVRV